MGAAICFFKRTFIASNCTGANTNNEYDYVNDSLRGSIPIKPRYAPRDSTVPRTQRDAYTLPPGEAGKDTEITRTGVLRERERKETQEEEEKQKRDAEVINKPRSSLAQSSPRT